MMKYRLQSFLIHIISLALALGMVRLSMAALKQTIEYIEGPQPAKLVTEVQIQDLPEAEQLRFAVIHDAEVSGTELQSYWNKIRITEQGTLHKLVRLLERTTKMTIGNQIRERGTKQRFAIGLYTKDGQCRTLDVQQSNYRDQLYVSRDGGLSLLLENKAAKELLQLLADQKPLDVSDPEQIEWAEVTLLGSEEKTFTLEQEQYAALSDGLQRIRDNSKIITTGNAASSAQNALVEVRIQFRDGSPLYLLLEGNGRIYTNFETAWSRSDTQAVLDHWAYRYEVNSSALNDPFRTWLQQASSTREQWQRLDDVDCLVADVPSSVYGEEMHNYMLRYPVTDPSVLTRFCQLVNEAVLYNVVEPDYADHGVGITLHWNGQRLCDLSMQWRGGFYFLYRWDTVGEWSIWALDAVKAEELLELLSAQSNVTQLMPEQIEGLVIASPDLPVLLATEPMTQHQHSMVSDLMNVSTDTAGYLDVSEKPLCRFPRGLVQTVCDALWDAQDAKQTNFPDPEKLLMIIKLQLQYDVVLTLNLFGNERALWLQVLDISPMITVPMQWGSSNFFQLEDPKPFLSLLEECRKAAELGTPADIFISSSAPQPEPEPEPEIDFASLDFTQVEKIEFLYPIENGTLGVNVDPTLAEEIGALVTATLEHPTAPVSFVDPDSSMVLYFPDGGQLALIYQPAEDGYHLTLFWHAPGVQSARAYGYFIPGDDPFAELFAEWAP